jgi:cell division protein FtsZ
LAAQQAINSPLLQDINIKGAKGLLMNITGPKDMSAHEMSDAASIIHEEAGDDADIISGIVTDPDITDEIRVTVIATGIDNNELGLSNVNENPLRNINIDEEIEINDSFPTYKQKELESKRNSINTNENSDNGNILSFGDEDLDIPAFIRNKKSIN